MNGPGTACAICDPTLFAFEYIEYEANADPVKYAIWLGIDIGKTDQRVTAIDDNNKNPYFRFLPNDEYKLRQIYQELFSQAQLLVVADPSATSGGCISAHGYKDDAFAKTGEASFCWTVSKQCQN